MPKFLALSFGAHLAHFLLVNKLPVLALLIFNHKKCKKMQIRPENYQKKI